MAQAAGGGGVPGKGPEGWGGILPSTPWKERRRALQALFEGIAPSYDRLNRLLSLGIDRRWRRRAAREAAGPADTGRVLDLASGTGDQAVALLRRAPRLTVLRLDLSAALLARAEPKLRDPRGSSNYPAGARTPAIVGEMERLPLRPGTCAAITMAFALRHVENLGELMRACATVLRPGGRVAFVDMALPESGPWGSLYRLYFARCLPRIARLLGGEREAYELMVRSVSSFPGWDKLAAAASDAGFVDVRSIGLTGGAARVFVAMKAGAAAQAVPSGPI